MALVKQSYIIEQMRSKSLNFFIVKEGAQIVDLQDDEGTSTEGAIDQLTETLNSIESGILEIAVSNKSRKQKAKGGDANNFTYKVRIGENKTDQAGAGGLLREIYELRAQMDKKEFEHQLQEVERRLSKKDKKESLMDNPMVQQAIGALISKYGAGAGAVADAPGIHGVETPETKTKITQEEKALLANSVSRLSKVDPDIINTLVKLANLAEENPAKYNMAKSFL